jgi:voltage-gated potassium channel
MDLSKKRIAHIVFESNDRASRTFDVVVLILILGSVTVVILDSVSELHLKFGNTFYFLEWVFTLLFTIEYALRIWLTNKTFRYAVSFYGIVDLLAILPGYLGLFIANTQLLTVVRALRLLRVIRVLKLGRYISEADFIKGALKASATKIQLFLFSVLTIVLIMGTLMFIIEGPEAGFTSIPVSMYWSIVTLTTVGFGDITPQTPLGQFIASLIMLLGYAIIAVPTGIVTSEMAKRKQPPIVENSRTCTFCGKDGIDPEDNYCKNCGEKFL